MPPPRPELPTAFYAAEVACVEVFPPGKTLAEKLNHWLCAEVAFQKMIGCAFISEPSHLPKEPYQLNLWEAMATAMRAARLAQYGQQFPVKETL